MDTFYRKEKIEMFLLDYFFGCKKYISILRVIGGPLLIYQGTLLYLDAPSKVIIGFASFLFIYGIYMIVRPFLWVLLRLNDFNTEEINVEISENQIVVKNNHSESKVDFDLGLKIEEHKNHYTISLSKTRKIRLPKRLISKEGQVILLGKVNT
jgi:hypothetical protein